VEIDERAFVRRQLFFFRKYVQAHLAGEVTKAQMLKALKELKARFWKKNKIPSISILRLEFEWSRHAVMRELDLDPWRCFSQDTDNQIMQAVCDTMISEVSKKK